MREPSRSFNSAIHVFSSRSNCTNAKNPCLEKPQAERFKVPDKAGESLAGAAHRLGIKDPSLLVARRFFGFAPALKVFFCPSGTPLPLPFKGAAKGAAKERRMSRRGAGDTHLPTFCLLGRFRATRRKRRCIFFILGWTAQMSLYKWVHDKSRSARRECSPLKSRLGRLFVLLRLFCNFAGKDGSPRKSIGYRAVGCNILINAQVQSYHCQKRATCVY